MGNLPHIRLNMLNFIQQIRGARESGGLDILREPNVCMQTVEALVLGGQVIVFDHGFEKDAILVEGTLTIINTLLLSLIFLVLKHKLINFLVCYKSHLPFLIEDLIFQTHILKVWLSGAIKFLSVRIIHI